MPPTELPGAIRRTKLVCTIGPASGSRIAELVAAGMDIGRLNLSHGDRQQHAANADSIRQSARDASTPVALLLDLPGPKVRLGRIANGEVTLTAGEAFRLRSRTDSPGDVSGVSTTHSGLAGDLHRGDLVLLADGAVELAVVRSDHDDVVTEVVRGGTVRSRSGVNVPASRLSLPAITDADRAGLALAEELDADFVAQSFVRSARDLTDLRATMARRRPLIAKIETRSAIEDFERILEQADAVMIARGDLGAEIPFAEVPIIQKQLVRQALSAGVPSIVATQMLESMTAAPRPTRAEASDVANAVLDGADAVMLSGETAIGAYPVAAAAAAVAISAHADSHLASHQWILPDEAPQSSVADAAAALARNDPEVVAIGCYTRSGRTARLMAARRPRVPIVAVSPDAAVSRELTVVSGVVPLTGSTQPDAAGGLRALSGIVARSGVLPARSRVVLLASTDAGAPPNLLEVALLGATD